MSIPELCEKIQDAWLSRVISESTWGYPIVGALHVLAIALFGGAILAYHLRVLGFAFRNQQVSDLARDVRWIRRIGLMLVLTTGALVFSSGAVAYYEGTSFRIKIVLLALILLTSIATSRIPGSKLLSAISLALWSAVIFASRGIAFF